MKERPIIFSGEMVRAILDGRKTQTRRIVKPQPPAVTDGRWSWVASSSDKSEVGKFRYSWPNETGTSFTAHGRESGVSIRCPYGETGDRLWVREAWALFEHSTGVVYRADAGDDGLVPYLDNGAGGLGGGVCDYAPDRWKPSIHMPRWASRITLEIKGVRVERLQDIGESDAEAEGFHREGCGGEGSVRTFARLWESLYGTDSWSVNPWVWVIEFERVEE